MSRKSAVFSQPVCTQLNTLQYKTSVLFRNHTLAVEYNKIYIYTLTAACRKKEQSEE